MEKLYHYCSVESFYKIISSKSISLSLLDLSNDFKEGRLVPEVFGRLLSKSELAEPEVEEIHSGLRFIEEQVDGLGVCLSEEPDLLSQWRGYADDGHGFSIGFSSRYFSDMSRKTKGTSEELTLKKVLYEESEHECALRPTFDQIHQLIDSGEVNFRQFGLMGTSEDESGSCTEQAYKQSRDRLFSYIVELMPQFYVLKSKAFSEEKEWRLVSLLVRYKDYDFDFNPKRKGIIPFRSYDLDDLEERPILEVVIGPKNRTPEYVVKTFLYNNGFDNVEVRKSSATYW